MLLVFNLLFSNYLDLPSYEWLHQTAWHTRPCSKELGLELSCAYAYVIPRNLVGIILLSAVLIQARLTKSRLHCTKAKTFGFDQFLHNARYSSNTLDKLKILKDVSMSSDCPLIDISSTCHLFILASG